MSDGRYGRWLTLTTRLRSPGPSPAASAVRIIQDNGLMLPIDYSRRTWMLGHSMRLVDVKGDPSPHHMKLSSSNSQFMLQRERHGIFLSGR